MFTAVILKFHNRPYKTAATKKKLLQQNVAHDQQSVRHWLRLWSVTESEIRYSRLIFDTGV